MKVERVESLVSGHVHFVRLTTDDGLIGVGQSGCWAYPHAVDAVVREWTGYLVGCDPRHIEHHWNALYRMGPFRGSILGAALSAVDIALWDVKAQRLGAPVWDLLGGSCRDRIRLLHLIHAWSSVDELLAAARDALEDGFTAVKFAPFVPCYAQLTPAELKSSILEVVSAVRDCVGTEIDLVVEFGRALDPLHAASTIDDVAAAAPLFCEDPIQIDSIAAQAELARKVRQALGQGERLHTIWEFRELLAGGPQYLRACVGLAGGITHCKKIAAVAEAHHADVVWHNWLGPILTAASLHLDIAVPNVPLQEYLPKADEGSLAAAFASTLNRDGGYLMRPEAPGLGVRIDDSRLTELDLLGRELWDMPIRADGSIAWAT